MFSRKLLFLSLVFKLSSICMIFDYALTAGLEVALIWPSKWSIMKVLFLLSRYSAAVDVPLMVYSRDIPLDRCYRVHGVLICFNLCGIAVAEAIFVVRTYALSGRSRKVLAVFGAEFTVNHQTPAFGPPPLPTIPGCFLTGGTLAYAAIPFALALSFDTSVVAFTLWLGIKNYRHSSNPFIVVLYRDGITYYFFLCIISAVNVFVLLGGPPKMPDLLNNLLRVMHSILSTRVILHIREVEQKRADDSIAVESHSRVCFRQPEQSTDF
ncbi:hypothetical protein C8R43DRAFT_946805 [Mycena crocata]|nr:hypothetical protein C8R43DRAFT_946805 [Mycena crocata]